MNSSILSKLYELVKILENPDENFFYDVMSILLSIIALFDVRNHCGCFKNERSPERKNWVKNKYIHDVYLAGKHHRVEVETYKCPDSEPGMIDLIIAGQRADTEKFIVDLYLRGHSIKEIVKTLEKDGREPLKKESVRKIINKFLLPEVEQFKNQPIPSDVQILFTDALYEYITIDGKSKKRAVIMAVGLLSDGRLKVLDVQVCDGKESRRAYTRLFKSLLARGMNEPALVCSDGHKGLRKAVRRCFPNALWQLCAIHLRRMVRKAIPKNKLSQEEYDAISEDLSAIWEAATYDEAIERGEAMVKRLEPVSPKAARKLSNNLASALTCFDITALPRKTVLNTNLIERLNRTIRNRSDIGRSHASKLYYLRTVVPYLLDHCKDTLSKRQVDPYDLAEAVKQIRGLKETAVQNLKPESASEPESCPALPLVYIASRETQTRVGSAGFNVQTGLAVGVGAGAQRHRAALTVSLSGDPGGAEAMAREVFENLSVDPEMIVYDPMWDGLEEALERFFPGVELQPDVERLAKQIAEEMPSAKEKETAGLLKEIWNAPDIPEASALARSCFEELSPKYPEAARKLEESFRKSLVFYCYSETELCLSKLCKAALAGDKLEQILKQIGKGCAPPEASVLSERLEAELTEIEQNWNRKNGYLNRKVFATVFSV